MPLNRGTVASYLHDGRLTDLFIEELGWDEAATTTLEVQVEGQTFLLRPIAQKRGVMALLSRQPTTPRYAVRRKIETQVARRYREHIVVFEDETGQEQVWQWVRREPGLPLQSREHVYRRSQSSEALAQKLERIRFSLEQEEDLTLVDVVGQVRAAFNVEPATRKFFQEFKRQHDAFQAFLQGIPDGDLAGWYVSVMLNRLMFIYFIQKKGFLDGNPDYLRRRLDESERAGPDRYYRELLCPLFFEGFAKPESQRDPATRARLGRVPYLNGGIFNRHQVEQLYGQAIQIPDLAFRRLFDFFDRYQWHLDDRPLRKADEINPDVLGYIFEQYINQKAMGAYYTKEDITEYISKNTIIPFLFDRAQALYPAAFRGEHAHWRLLQDEPDRYIYDAMRKGVALPLPPEIAAGLEDVGRRGAWNSPAPDEYALPTEIWRETVARRQRYEEVWLKLAEGEVGQINDLITLNLDIRQFVQDVIEQTADPDVVRAFWRAAGGVTVLDPTCGSGAFLFAALNILKPIYEGCLDRMAQLVAELPPGAPPQTYRDFKETLAEIERHPNREYFILKRIMVDNLYGVDIMEEAVEIAKLRLFLKLAAQVEDAGRMEPLPDIDFNIRAGNTLVGFTSLADVERAVRGAGTQQERLILLPEDEAQLAEIQEEAGHVDRLFGRFRHMQTAHDVREWSEDFAATKAELRRRLGVLEDRLNRLLALQYSVDPEKSQQYDPWLKSHRPFHWLVEFYGIMSRGGFDVAIGNPPYVEYAKVRAEYAVQGYRTERSGNLYALVLERTVALVMRGARAGMIVPISSFATSRMDSLQQHIRRSSESLWISSYGIRPAKLFEGAEQRLSICLWTGAANVETSVYTTKYHRWYEQERHSLLSQMVYQDVTAFVNRFGYVKASSGIEQSVLSKMPTSHLARLYYQDSSEIVYWHRIPAYFIKAVDFVPHFLSNRDGVTKSEDYKVFGVLNRGDKYPILALLNSSLFYWYWFSGSDGYHCGKHEVLSFPVDFGYASEVTRISLVESAQALMESLRGNSRLRSRNQKTTVVQYQEFYPSRSKLIADEIDRTLAQHYGFTDEELDFIINYDIKYRMGDELLDDGE